MEELEHPHSMTYKERETLKAFAHNGKCLADALTMIAHWMRQSQDISFSGYAANWSEANRARGIEAMRQQWPLATARFIADGTSEWGSALPDPLQ